VPQPGRPARTPPVVFDARFWDEDMRRATEGGRRVATAARDEYETAGVPYSELRACASEGSGGTSLPSCMKIYVPPPAGPHGMVLRIARGGDGRLALAYLAFGLRHPGPNVRQPSVYEVAHRRLTQAE
jgi:hypothetical protein